MKILFAVNNDNVSEAIVKKYQKEYKEILSYKNVYYFNAILRELQKDKSYSRIVISEDLEPFANNNYDSIDKFLYEKYSSISEEIQNVTNGKIDIILICADRRKKTDNMLTKIYKKNIYNAIIGQDRSIDEICKLINQPKDKQEAQIYYGIHESELGQTESEDSVSEAEVENIRAHYARLGKNEDKYVESFNNIVAQYTDNQLRIIIKYLPLNVKAVLEEKSPKYQQLAITTNFNKYDVKKKTDKYKEEINKENDKQDKVSDEIVQQLIKPKNIRSVVIPKNIATNDVQKIDIPKDNTLKQNNNTVKENNTEIDNEFYEEGQLEEIEINQESNEKTNKEIEKKQEQKRGRGRPRKNSIPDEVEEKPKRGRGRPKKNVTEEQVREDNEIEEKNQELEVDLFSLDDEKIENEVQGNQTQEELEVDLFNIKEPEKTMQEPEIDLFNIEEPEKTAKESDVDLFNIIEDNQQENKTSEPEINQSYRQENRAQENKDMVQSYNYNTNYNTLLTADKKIVAFVGTTKNGTSFVVNNTAEMLSSMGIETAILDMTKTKNAYYIYTNNEESLRNISRECMQNLQNGVAEGIKVNKNLTVYTEMPGEEKEYDIETVLSTLVNNYSAVLIDTDFETSQEVFARVQEIYLVQTMDVLTIQPLTAFLRNLKSKDILNQEKLKIVINKSQKVRSLNVKTLIGGMSCYNSPSMTYMTELFNKDNVPYCEIPFEVQNYVKYLDSLVNCSISLNGYTKQFITSLRELANMVYPLVNKQVYSTNKKERRDPFSSQINDTLNKMKNRY